MNNFRIVGNYYISKTGNNSNVGTSDFPKKDFSYYGASLLIVGTGIYDYAGGFYPSAYTDNYFIADGTVVLNQTGNVLSGDFSWGNTNLNYNTANTRGWFYVKGNGFSITLYGLPGGSAWRRTVFDATTINTNTNCLCSFVDCVFVAGSITIPQGNYVQVIRNATILGTAMSFPSTIGTYELSNSYSDESTTLIWNNFVSDFNLGKFFNNNFRGKINVGGTDYELKKDKNGIDIPSRISNGIADIDVLVGGIGAIYTTRKNFAQDPQFLNLAKGDYWTVASTSPNIVSKNPKISNIGNSRIGNALVGENATDFPNLLGLTSSAGDLSLIVGQTIGYAISKPLQIDAVARQLDVTYIQMLLTQFDSDDVKGPAPLFSNNNYVIATKTNEVSGTAGANPRRLNYEMRWSNKETIPLIDSDWDNEGFDSNGNFYLFEHNSVPRISFDGSNFYGNGDYRYTLNDSVNIKAKWVQFKLYIIQGY